MEHLELKFRANNIDIQDVDKDNNCLFISYTISICGKEYNMIEWIDFDLEELKFVVERVDTHFNAWEEDKLSAFTSEEINYIDQCKDEFLYSIVEPFMNTLIARHEFSSSVLSFLYRLEDCCKSKLMEID
jgi:hypothetical protein